MSKMIALAWLGLATAGAWAGPGLVLSTGPYNVTLPYGAGSYMISSDVYFNAPGYTYTYKVESLNSTTHTFELGLASDPYFWGNYTETNPQVTAGPGVLLHDQLPHTTIMPWLGRHNYVFTDVVGKNRVGITIDPGETQVLSFDAGHAPELMRWSLREYVPFTITRNNIHLQAGQLPVPGAPEPSSLALACFGVAGLGLNVLRRRRARMAQAMTKDSAMMKDG
jgi:hypothetical protein